MVKPGNAILIVEDSPEDYAALVRALARADVRQPLVRCLDGDDALDWLRRQGRYAGQSLPWPVLVLLDLNLPGTDGREVLGMIKADEALSYLPVVILTTSSNPRDVADCYRAGANTYLMKPVNLSQFYEAVACLARYWLQTATLPNADTD